MSNDARDLINCHQTNTTITITKFYSKKVNQAIRIVSKIMFSFSSSYQMSLTETQTYCMTAAGWIVITYFVICQHNLKYVYFSLHNTINSIQFCWMNNICYKSIFDKINWMKKMSFSINKKQFIWSCEMHRKKTYKLSHVFGLILIIPYTKFRWLDLDWK